MMLALLHDLTNVLDDMPPEHPHWRLVAEIRRVLHLRLTELETQPTTLFQTLWNELVELPTSAVWYEHVPPSRAVEIEEQTGLTWARQLLPLKAAWTPDFPWLRVLGTSHPRLTWDETVLRTFPAIKVAISPDERFLSAADMLRQVDVWDAHSNALLASIRVDELVGNPSLLEFSADERYLALGTHDGGLAVIDWRASTVLLSDHPVERTWGLQQAWFSEDNSTVTFVDSRRNCTTYRLAGLQTEKISPATQVPSERGVFRQCGATFWSYDFERYESYELGNTDDRGVVRVYRIEMESGVRRNLLQTEGTGSDANLVVSPDGSRFAWCKYEVVQVYDGETGSLLATLTAPSREEHQSWDFRRGKFGNPSEFAPVWSRDGRTLAVFVESSRSSTMHTHGQIWVWNPDANHVQWRIPLHGQYTNLSSLELFTGGRQLVHDAGGCRLLSQHNVARSTVSGLCPWDEEIVSYALSGDGRNAAFATHRGEIHLLNLPSRQRIATLPAAKPRKVEYLQLSFDGTQVAWWQKQDVNFQLYLMETSRLDPRPVAEGMPGSLLFSANGDLLVAVGRDLTCIPTKDITRRHTVTLPKSTDSIFELSSESRWLALAAQQTCVWKLSPTSDHVHLLASDDATEPKGFRLDPEGRRVVLHFDRRGLRGHFRCGSLDRLRNEIEWDFEEQDKLLTRAAWGPGPECITFIRRPGILRVVNMVTRTIVAEARISEAEIHKLAVNRQGHWIATTGFDGAVRLVDLQHGGTVSTLNAYDKFADDVQFDHSGTRLMSLGDVGYRATNRVKLWNVEMQTTMFELQHEKGIYAAALSPDGRHVAACCGDEVLRLWEVGRSEPRWSVSIAGRGPNPYYGAMAWSPDGCALVHSMMDGVVVDRDIAEGHKRHQWRLPASNLIAMEYTPEGDALVVCGSSPVVHLHDALTGEHRHLLRGHTNPVTRMRFAPQSDLCATNSNDGDVIVWDVTSGKEVARHRFPFDHGSTQLALLTKEAAVFMENSAGVAVWDCVEGRKLNKLESIRRQAAAVHEGFTPIVLDNQSRRSLKLRRTAQQFAWFSGGGLEGKCSSDGSRWALIDHGRVTLFELYFGTTPVSENPDRLFSDHSDDRSNS